MRRSTDYRETVTVTLEIERCSECGGAPEQCHCVVPDGVDRPLAITVVGEVEHDDGIPARWTGCDVDYGEPGYESCYITEIRCGEWEGDGEGLTARELARIDEMLYEAAAAQAQDREDARADYLYDRMREEGW